MKQNIEKFFNAIQDGDIEKQKQLLYKDPELIYRTNQFGETALHVAVELGNLENAEFLIEQGAEINATTKYAAEYTALHIACADDYYEIAKLLIKYNANVNAVNKWGTTPLSLAVQNKNLKIIDLLLQHYAKLHIMPNIIYKKLHTSELSILHNSNRTDLVAKKNTNYISKL